ncbi:hypothetical protein JCM15519_25780 [Fundidesulfovibrio butyratiphilus]
MTAARTGAENDRQRQSLRWLDIAARTAHLGAAAMLFGCAATAGPAGNSTLWQAVVLATGFLLAALEWLRDRHWPHRGAGLLTFLHVGLVVVLRFHPDWTLALLWAILVVGSVCSHMPRGYRHWSIVQGWERRENTGPNGADAG